MRYPRRTDDILDSEGLAGDESNILLSRVVISTPVIHSIKGSDR